MFKIINRGPSQLFKLSFKVREHATPIRSFNNAKYGLFAGHSKWANIRHIKAAKDGQKAALFTKMSRQIRLAIQDGGSPDVSLNSQLKTVVDEALRKNMPLATIQNNINKYKNNKTELKRYTIELRFKQKVFGVCVIYTDNFSAVKMELAPIFRKSGATLIDTKHLFEEIGFVQAVIDKTRVQKGNGFEDVVTDDAITFGAEEVEIIDEENGIVNFLCRPFEIMSLRKIIDANGYTIENADHVYIPLNVVELPDGELLEYQKFISKLKEVSGVEEIYDNVNPV